MLNNRVLIYSALADLLIVVHFAFIILVIFGGLLIFWKKWIVFLHIPAVIWAALIEFKGWICPLTPLENQLRRAAGETGYTGGFIEQYLVPVFYYDNLTREIQILLGISIIVINVILYTWLFYRYLKRRKTKI